MALFFPCVDLEKLRKLPRGLHPRKRIPDLWLEWIFNLIGLLLPRASVLPCKCIHISWTLHVFGSFDLQSLSCGWAFVCLPTHQPRRPSKQRTTQELSVSKVTKARSECFSVPWKAVETINLAGSCGGQETAETAGQSINQEMRLGVQEKPSPCYSFQQHNCQYLQQAIYQDTRQGERPLLWAANARIIAKSRVLLKGVGPIENRGFWTKMKISY